MSEHTPENDVPRLRETPPTEPVTCGHFRCRNYTDCLWAARDEATPIPPVRGES